MRRVVHIGRLMQTAFLFGRGGGRVSVLVIVVLGLLALALAVTAQAVVPIAAYPFA